MCEAMDFLRECVGEKMILGCGVPLMPAFGKVDYCRIGADMGLRWKVPFFSNREFISTYHTLGNSIFRRQLDGRAFYSDPKYNVKEWAKFYFNGIIFNETYIYVIIR